MAVHKLDYTTSSEILEAVQLYAQEAVIRYEEDLMLPVDAFRQPEAPWC
jgi:hypothetical protein